MLPLLCCLAALGLPGARADFWDDFSNNLATDLAPFVSLFGEQTTKQYLSESITRLDYFIFAMAPIGILTALVSAIRVCGSPSLRAFIGRAQEGEGNAEAELCSSTSRDVCELYNNGGIARVFGRPKILEVVHDPNAPVSEFDSPDGSAGIYTFREYVKTGNGKKEWTLRRGADVESPPEEYAPNLSHNVGIKRPDDWVFVVVALLGLVLQGGVLVFAACVTYYLRWQKNDEQPPSYACPLVITGTVAMCAGVYLCAHLVGQSTQEHIFRREKASVQKSSLFWVQPHQVIGDQTFDPFCHVDHGGDSSLRQYTASWKERNKSSELVVWLAVGISVAGFVLQFVGLRGIHSAISVAQLGAALAMSAARSALRMQRLSTKDNDLSTCRDLVDRHELDWLALRIGEKAIKAALPPEPSVPSGGRQHRHYFWRFCGMAGGRDRVMHKPPPDPNHANAVGKVLAYRSRLAYLTDSGAIHEDAATPSRCFTAEMVEVRAMAQKLVLAIESTATRLFSISPKLERKWKKTRQIFWPVSCCVSSSGWVSYQEKISSPLVLTEPDNHILYLKLRRVSTKPGSEENYWRLENKQDLEAIMGLWMWSLKSDFSANATNLQDNTWNYSKPVSASTQLRRIVSWNKHPDDTGLASWLPSHFPSLRESKISGTEQDCTPYSPWNFKGEVFRPWHGSHPDTPGLDSAHRLFGWYAAESEPLNSFGTSGCTVWTLPTNCTLLSLCSQEIFAVFVTSMLEVAQDIGEVQLEHTDFHFTNRLVSQVVEAFTEAQLGSKDDALLCVLPQVVLRETSAGRTPLWHAASNGHEQMVDQLLRTHRFDLNVGDHQHRRPLWQAASNGHAAVVELLLEHGAEPMTADSTGVTPLSQAAANGHETVVQLLLEKGLFDLDFMDSEGCTALGRAVANSREAVVKLLLEEGADVNAGHATPLSQAIAANNEAMVTLLRQHSQELEYVPLGSGLIENDEGKIRLAKSYESIYGRFLRQYIRPSRKQRLPQRAWRPPIRIAILATGVDLEELIEQTTIRMCKSWVNTAATKDNNGHGTQLTALTQRYAPFAEIYVAKVCENQYIRSEDLVNFRAAITWAVENCEVDIIEIPFGLSSMNKDIQASLKLAQKRSTVVFAAATGIGFSQRRCYPARSSYVIGIHGVDGRGKDCGISAAPVKNDYNFSALGVCAPSNWKGEKEFVSGSSYATAVAAGAAASFLEFARFNLDLQDHPEDQKWLCSTEGIREMLRLMSTEIDGYRCIAPSELFSNRSTIEGVREIIMMSIQKRKKPRGL